MANEFGVNLQNYSPALKQMGIEIYSSAGTPTANGPAKGALVIDTTNGILYINEGTAAAATWQNIQAVAAAEITLAEGNLLIGNASGVATALVVKTSGQILVGNGTTGVSVAVSGDASLSSAGALTVTGANAAFNVGTNVTLTKEVNHTITVTASTTTNTAGATLGVAAAAGVGTGAGGAMSVTGGASGAGATGNGGVSNVTGGAALSTNGNGGDVVLTGGVATGTGVSGKIMNRSIASVLQGAQTAKTVSATLTAAEVLAGIITVNQAAGGTSAQQLPTATDLDTALPTFAANDAFDFSVINISTVDAEDASVTTNTGWTLVGNMDIHAYSAAGSLNSSARFRARKTGAAAWTLYRIS